MNNVAVKVIGQAGNEVPTVASEIALALRLAGFKVSIAGKLAKETPKSQTKRVKELISSDHHIFITWEQLPRVESHA
jgi:hypothetical protein